MKFVSVQLLAVDQQGALTTALLNCPEMIEQSCKFMGEFYKLVGFQPPWIGYVTVSDGRAVGGGAFKGPPQSNRVEIAYYTLLELVGRGFASATARELIRVARLTDPLLTIAAQTLPVVNASNTLLKKLGFTFQGALLHPEDGEVWEWHLAAQPALEDVGRA